MCRLLGIVTSEPTRFRVLLEEAPRSLAALSRGHPHGWGIAVWDAENGWTVHRRAACADGDARFHELAAASAGHTLVAHVRKGTVGLPTEENTHPFRRGRWVFGHNGTVQDCAWLRSRTSEDRIAEVRGETDSELLFAYLLSRLDEADAADGPAGDDTDRALRDASRELTARPGVGAVNFLLSDGETTYAHRFGRSLFLLERGPHDRARARFRSAQTGAVVETPWSPRRYAVLVASERVTDEPWWRVPEETLVRTDRLPVPACRVIE